jgi:PEP-CTERM motif
MPKVRSDVCVAAVLLGVILGVPAPSEGDVIYYSFSGTITYFAGVPGLGGAPQVGDVLSGTFTVDSNIPDTVPDPTLAIYNGSVIDVVLNYPLLIPFDNPSFHGALVYDNYDCCFAGPLDLLYLFIGDPEITIDFFLFDFSGTAFNSTALPRSLNVSDFSEESFVALFGPPFPELYFQYEASITSLEVSSVPEPASLALVGLASFFGYRKYRRSARKPRPRRLFTAHVERLDD